MVVPSRPLFEPTVLPPSELKVKVSVALAVQVAVNTMGEPLEAKR